MVGFKAYVRYLFGLDPEVRVSNEIEAWTHRLVATRELEVQYVTDDARTRLLDEWADVGGERDVAGAYEAASNDAFIDDWATRLFGTYVPDSAERQPGGEVQGMPYRPPLRFGTIDEVLPDPAAIDGGTDEAATTLGTLGLPDKPTGTRRHRFRRRTDESRSRIVREAAAAAKVKFGLPKATEANLLVVSKYIRDWLDDHGVRPTHIEGIAPHAVALVFIPTQADIQLREMLASSTAVNMQARYDATYFSDSPKSWWRPSTWFGRAYARPFAG